MKVRGISRRECHRCGRGSHDKTKRANGRITCPLCGLDMWDSHDFSTGDVGAWTDSDDIAPSESLARHPDPGAPAYADIYSKINWYHETSPSKGTANSQTVITLAPFTATAHEDYVLVEWETDSKIDNAGFNVWQAEGKVGPYTILNDTLIPAKGGSTIGANFSYLDDTVIKGVTFLVQARRCKHGRHQ